MNKPTEWEIYNQDGDTWEDYKGEPIETSADKYIRESEFERKRHLARLRINKLHKRMEKWHDSYIKIQNKDIEGGQRNYQIEDARIRMMWSDSMNRINGWYFKMSKGELMEDWEMIAANNLWLSYKPNTKATDCSAVKSA